MDVYINVVVIVWIMEYVIILMGYVLLVVKMGILEVIVINVGYYV